MTAADLLLVALGAVAVGAGFRVVRTPHLVRAGLWLVVTLGAVAGSYLVLAAELVAWVQVLLYVGAVVVVLRSTWCSSRLTPRSGPRCRPAGRCSRCSSSCWPPPRWAWAWR